VIFVPIFFAFAYRIRVEEQALSEHFGDKYEQYCRKTRRLLPMIY
jgi:protein-S-isoprenylcysteine O-methyltransferase Ste14